MAIGWDLDISNHNSLSKVAVTRNRRVLRYKERKQTNSSTPNLSIPDVSFYKRKEERRKQLQQTRRANTFLTVSTIRHQALGSLLRKEIVLTGQGPFEQAKDSRACGSGCYKQLCFIKLKFTQILI